MKIKKNLHFLSNLILFNFIYSLSYNPVNYTHLDINDLLPIPYDSKYQSNETCVTYNDLIDFNYTDRPNRFNNPKNVFPENFCYSMLTYNISRNDFFDIVDKNLQAFYNYRRLISLWSLYNYTINKNMDDQCAGYFRNVACWSQFPACVDNGDNTWTPSTICENYCNIYLVRCGDFAVKTLCDRTSPLDYCAGYMSSKYFHFSYINILLLLLFILFL